MNDRCEIYDHFTLDKKGVVGGDSGRLNQRTEPKVEGVQKLMTPPPISAARRNQKVFDQSFNKVFSIMSDNPFQSLRPVLEQALEFLKSDAVKQVCQRLDYRISISKSPILQCCLGPSKESEVALAQTWRIMWMAQSLELHSVNWL
jgi:hypothetical protein